METNKIEFRRGNAGGGNQLRQPYLKRFMKKSKSLKIFKYRTRSSLRLLYWKLSRSI